jgi:hypothetical protein
MPLIRHSNGSLMVKEGSTHKHLASNIGAYAKQRKACPYTVRASGVCLGVTLQYIVLRGGL